MSEAVLGPPSQPITRVPSAVMDSAHCRFGLVVSRSTVPVPSAAWMYRFITPARVDANTIRRPSGVQTGPTSKPGSKVKRLSVSRARSQIQMSTFP